MSEQMDLVNSMLRCPCCGGAVTLCYDPTMVAGQRNWIRCNECGLRSAYHRTCHSAIAAWNQRAGEAELAALRKRILWFVRMMYGIGVINGTQAGELVGLSLPDVLKKVELGEWPAQGEVAAAETRALRDFRERVRRQFVEVPTGAGFEWWAKLGAQETWQNIGLILAACDKAMKGCDEAAAAKEEQS